MDEVSSYVRLDLPSYGNAAPKIVPPYLRIPYKGLGADSEEKREPASDIDTATVDGMKALDPDRPIREADMCANPVSVSSRIGRIRGAISLRLTVADLRL